MTSTPLTVERQRTHPGALLREIVLPACDYPTTEIVRRLGISRSMFYDIMSEKKPVTAQVALRLGKLFGNGPTLWINMQSQYDLQKAEAEMSAELAGIETIQAA